MLPFTSYCFNFRSFTASQENSNKFPKVRVQSTKHSSLVFLFLFSSFDKWWSSTSISLRYSRVSNTYPRVLNTYSRVLNTYSRVLNTYPRVLNTYSRVLNTYPRVLNTYPRVLNTYSRVLNTYSRVLNTYSSALKTCRNYFKTYYCDRKEYQNIGEVCLLHSSFAIYLQNHLHNFRGFILYFIRGYPNIFNLHKAIITIHYSSLDKVTQLQQRTCDYSL